MIHLKTFGILPIGLNLKGMKFDMKKLVFFLLLFCIVFTLPINAANAQTEDFNY